MLKINFEKLILVILTQLTPLTASYIKNYLKQIIVSQKSRVSVQGVKSLGGHFACLCRGFEFYEVKKKNLLLFFKKKMEIFIHF